MDNWKLLLAGIRNSLKELVKNTFNIKGSVDVSNLPEIQKVEITNPQEPTETVQVSNLIDYKEYFNKIIGELIKVPKDIKTADYTPIIGALKEVVRTLENDKTDYSPIILSISSAVKELKDAYPTFNVEPIVNLISGLQQFNLEPYLKYGELPVVINQKQIEKLVKVFGNSVGTVVSGGTANAISTIGLATSDNQTNGSQKTKVIDSAGNVQEWVMPEGQEASANSMPMVLSTEQEAILSAIKTSVEIMDDWDSGDTCKVTLQTSTNAIGKLAANSGVDIGDVDVTSISAGSNLIGDVGLQPRTSNGLSYFRSIDLDETEEEVKGSAGQLYGWFIHNKASTTTYVKIYNDTAANVSVGTTTPVLTIPMPANSSANMIFPIGVAFSTAITAAATTGVADNDTGAPAANDLIIDLFYK